MQNHRAAFRPLFHTAGYATAPQPPPAPSRSQVAPAARPFKPESPEERHSRITDWQFTEPVVLEKKDENREKKKPGIFPRIWSSKPQEPIYLGSSNPEQGAEAARRYVKEGVVDRRYAGAARRVTAMICATPILIYCSYELYQRLFNGKEQKKRPLVAPTLAEDSP
jgi:hypothetical protein